MKKLFCLATLLVASFSSQSSLLHDSDITPGVIFGSGNANGGWTIFQDSRNGLELGLRAKLRHDENGDPQNQFNSNGDGTYTFDAVSAPTQSNYVGVWSFEWAVNTNYNNRGRRPLDLDDYVFNFGIAFNGVDLFTPFDFINGANASTNLVLWDHAIGDNSTNQSTKSVATDAITYAALIADNNVAQNSQKIHWWAGSAAFDPTQPGTFSFTLTANPVIVNSGAPVGGGPANSVSIDVVTEAVAVNAPATFGLMLIGLASLALRRRVLAKTF